MANWMWWAIGLIVFVVLLYLQNAKEKSRVLSEDGEIRPVELTTYSALMQDLKTIKLFKPDTNLYLLKFLFPYLSEEEKERDEKKGVSPDYFTSIAGVSFRNDRSNVGVFRGVVIQQPDNEADKKALAIVSTYPEPRLVGYIAKDEHREYRKWSRGHAYPCAGYISFDSGMIYGRVKIIRPYSPDQVESDIEEFILRARKKYC